MSQTLVDRVRDAGRITFRDYMELALYDPGAGYYGAGRVRFGASGDFVTSSETHPIFGELLADWVAARWSELGCPDDFAVVE